MRRVRTLAAIMFATALLSACAAPSPEDDFVRGYHQAQAQHRAALFEKLEATLAASAANALAQARAYRQGRCDRLAAEDDVFDERGLPLYHETLRAIFYLDGRCVSADPERAKQALDAAIAKNPLDSEAIARLAALYWHGQGVDRNPDTARALASRAGFIAGLAFIETRIDADRNMADGLMIDQDLSRQLAALSFHFTNTLTGLWNLPPPLQAAQAWMAELYRAGGPGALNTGLNLSQGSNGYPHDPAMGFLWIKLARQKLSYHAADYPYAMALEDEAVQRAVIALQGWPQSPEAIAATLAENRCEALSALGFAANHDPRAMNELYRRYKEFAPRSDEDEKFIQRQFDEIVYGLHVMNQPIPPGEEKRLADYLALIEDGKAPAGLLPTRSAHLLRQRVCRW
ncbi:MAG: hypothetical protein Tsb0016_06020 [Sphingomonadales bacterium]